MVGEWAALWLVVGGVAVVPGYWVILQWAPQLATAFGVLILIGPLSALVCLIEIYIRWLIGFLLPNSPVGLLPGRPSFFNRGSLLLSSLATCTHSHPVCLPRHLRDASGAVGSLPANPERAVLSVGHLVSLLRGTSVALALFRC